MIKVIPWILKKQCAIWPKSPLTWSINILKHYFLVFRFVPEWLFINPWFHTGLFLVHALLLMAAAKYFWHLLKEYAKLNAMSQKPAVAIQLFLLPLFLSNFIGIVAARSLHYQVPVFFITYLTLLGLGLIKINDVSSNSNNPRPSLILNN